MKDRAELVNDLLQMVDDNIDEKDAERRIIDAFDVERNAALSAAVAIADGLMLANKMSGRDSTDAMWIRDEIRAKIEERAK